jgi:hypothetical protein
MPISSRKKSRSESNAPPCSKGLPASVRAFGRISARIVDTTTVCDTLRTLTVRRRARWARWRSLSETSTAASDTTAEKRSSDM